MSGGEQLRQVHAPNAPLSERYFYGVLISAAVACAVTGEMMLGLQILGAPGASAGLGQILPVLLVVLPASSVLGLVGGVAVLALPFALVRERGLMSRLLAGSFVGLIFDGLGIAAYLAPQAGIVGAVAKVSGAWLLTYPMQNLAQGSGTLAALQFAVPILGGLAAGYTFHRLVPAPRHGGATAARLTS